MKVAFVGGMQAKWLCAAWGLHVGGTDEAVWLLDGMDLAPHVAERIVGMDKVVWTATEDPAPKLAELEFAGESVWFPELRLDFLWPFGGQPHLLNTQHPYFAEGAFPLEIGDAWLNRALQGRRRWETIEQEYLALNVDEIVDLDAMKRLALERQSEIDAKFGFDFASRIEAGFRSGRQFANSVAPGAELMRMLAQAVFARLGVHAPIGEMKVFPSPEHPVHPSVAKHFSLAEPDRRYDLLSGEDVDFAEYVRRYLAYAEGPELEAGLRREAAGEAAEALALLEAAATRTLGQRSLTGRRATARASIRAVSPGEAPPEMHLFAAGDLADEDWVRAAAQFARRRWEEAEAGVVAYLRRTPGRAENFELLAAIREKRGDAEGRAAALELAVGLAPGHSRLQSQLTMALAGRGDYWGAIRSAEAEVAADPGNPHPRAYLAILLERVGHVERARQELRSAAEVAGDRPEHANLHAQLRRRLEAPAA